MAIATTHVDFTCANCDEIFEAYEMNRLRAIVEEDDFGDISMNVDVCNECSIDMELNMKSIEEADGTIVPVVRIEVLGWLGNIRLEPVA